MNFETYIGGIEDGMVTATKAALTPIGVRKIVTYSGDLDSETLKRELASKSAEFPKAMVSYVNGVDVLDPKAPMLPGKPSQFRHDCWFAVIVASNEARSEKARRRGFGAVPGTYEMLSKVREAISGLSIKTTGDDMLTFTPLKPITIENILRIPNVTAYAAIFQTYFRWKSLDTTTPGIQVTDLYVDVEGLNEHDPDAVQEKPGVILSAGN